MPRKLSFERPIGAQADVSELEYIYKLQEKSDEKGIRAKDICLLLRSKYGIDIEPPDVETLMNDFGCGEGAGATTNKAKSLDICLMTSMILAQQLLRVSCLGDMEQVEQVFGTIFHKIQLDVGFPLDTTSIDMSLIQRMVLSYGQVDTISMEDMQAMLNCCPQWDVDAFRCALVGDLQELNPESDQHATTHWQDVFEPPDKTKRRLPVRSQDNGVDEPTHPIMADPFAGMDDNDAAAVAVDDENPDEKQDVEEGVVVATMFQPRRVSTLSYIDRVAESYPSQIFSMVVLVCVMVFFVAYLFDYSTGLRAVNCDNFASDALCMISAGIVNWLLIMIQLILFGVPFTLLVSMGMSMYYTGKSQRTNLIQLSVGVSTVILAMILSVFFPIHSALLNNRNVDSLYKWSIVVSLTLGSLLLFFQLQQLARILMPSNKWLAPSMAYKEMASKQAATYKSQSCIDNALAMHEDDQPSSLALSKFFETSSPPTEWIGDIKWFCRNLRLLSKREGIWFHTRILSSNFVQVFLIGAIIAATTAGVRYINEYYDSDRMMGISRSASRASSWTLYIPGNVDPRLVTYVDWRYAHPVDEEAFRPEELESIQLNLMVQPLQLPTELGSWYFNEKALYFYNETTPDLISSRALQEYKGPFSDLSILNQIHGTTYNTSDYSPGQQILAISMTGLCQNPDAANFNVSLAQTCSSLFTKEVDQALTALSQGKWTIDDSVHLAASSTDLLVGNALASLAETVERPEAVAGIIAGGVTGIIAVLATSILYLPSYIVCVLQMRSGYIPIDKNFSRRYKTHTEDGSILFGSALWGCALSAGISGTVVGSIVFLTMWQESRMFMLAIFGSIVGWLVSIALKFLFLLLIRGLYIQSLYRDRPGASNVVNLAMECWHIALAAGFMLIQAIFLLTRTTIAIGHADTALPIAFRKDLIVSEAHRHPYIQRLTVFYLTKLRYGPKFCTRGGSCWRLIYVLALMPWLQKHRPGFDSYEMGTNSEEKKRSALIRLEEQNDILRIANQRLRTENTQYNQQVKQLRDKVMGSVARLSIGDTSVTSMSQADSSGQDETSPKSNTDESVRHEDLADSDMIQANRTVKSGTNPFDGDDSIACDSNHEKSLMEEQGQRVTAPNPFDGDDTVESTKSQDESNVDDHSPREIVTNPFDGNDTDGSAKSQDESEVNNHMTNPFDVDGSVGSASSQDESHLNDAKAREIVTNPFDGDDSAKSQDESDTRDQLMTNPFDGNDSLIESTRSPEESDVNYSDKSESTMAKSFYGDDSATKSDKRSRDNEFEGIHDGHSSELIENSDQDVSVVSEDKSDMGTTTDHVASSTPNPFGGMGSEFDQDDGDHSNADYSSIPASDSRRSQDRSLDDAATDCESAHHDDYDDSFQEESNQSYNSNRTPPTGNFFDGKTDHETVQHGYDDDDDDDDDDGDSSQDESDHSRGSKSMVSI